MTGMRLGTRLFVAQSVALLASVVAAAIVAALVGPPLFHAHLVESRRADGQPTQTHIEEAFVRAGTVSLGLGLLVALVLAAAMTWYVTRRIRRPLDSLAKASQQISIGDYATRVTVTGGGPELATLGAAFNQMAHRLGEVEDTRRRLLSDLSHELRTPIATLSAYLEGLSDGVLNWNDATRHTLQQQADRLAMLAHDLDDVSRAEEGRITLDAAFQRLDELVTDSVSQFRPRYAAAGVELRQDVKLVEVWADPQRIAQILSNLLANALRHTPSGGLVTLTGCSTKPTGHTAILAVTDNGEGMSPEQLSHVFERFYRGDTARARDAAGSGIGLTISRAIARAHHGDLTASSPGLSHGATFTLTLPMSIPPGASPTS